MLIFQKSFEHHQRQQLLAMCTDQIQPLHLVVFITQYKHPHRIIDEIETLTGYQWWVFWKLDDWNWNELFVSRTKTNDVQTYGHASGNYKEWFPNPCFVYKHMDKRLGTTKNSSQTRVRIFVHEAWIGIFSFQDERVQMVLQVCPGKKNCARSGDNRHIGNSGKRASVEKIHTQNSLWYLFKQFQV